MVKKKTLWGGGGALHMIYLKDCLFLNDTEPAFWT